MIWIIAAVAGLLIVYSALRWSRFRRFAEPVLSILVALALLSAFLVWWREGGSSGTTDTPPPFSQARPAVQPEQIQLENIVFTRNRTTDMSYRVTGVVSNRSAYALDYFRLSVALQDCPAASCKSIGDDTALVLARLLPGQSQPFETFFTFPNPYGVEPVAPNWSYRVTDASGRMP
ncbi:DUF3426 domain-containing protein [Pararhizobium gei]|uniref:DUF3426 domain-containing protein n=1 Tax=Pararhizobium gei TaxID=1395951 RepID=UPI0023DBC443|nr:hypothetical protein [Rhizobium gei]